ncbi:S-adenosylmethionine synthase-like [Saccoglossus kowalevskii]|uniref:S-adenosylmethionine synthase n=1 Tax=Saccoglossus kowalevskii TaxID=10224 RepID=A0ABM0GTX2_SACKO|nr:PREDICTED: S-adenosylmethionine synthase isoform type-2-like [Saccoglossus kowalevskii]
MSGHGGPGSDDTFLFSSESVKEGHPDKICDCVSDAILDAHLEQDPNAKVACECFASNGMILVSGEITSHAVIDYAQIVRDVVKEVGYSSSEMGFDHLTCNVMTTLQKQNPQFSHSMNKNRDLDHLGAADQGLMFGYATDETEECMPLTSLLAHRLNRKLHDNWKNGTMPWVRPDGKCQVTVEYKMDDGATVPLRVHNVLMSTQHAEKVSNEQIRQDLMDKVVKEVIPSKYLDDETVYYLNPSEMFTQGGTRSDAGLTGRKIIVDTYGGWGAHGGGAFSGKDCSKVDRSGAYAARWVAKSLVKAGLCRRCLFQRPHLHYAIRQIEWTYGSATTLHYCLPNERKLESGKQFEDYLNDPK